ncbi:MAG: fasciclin domain-containing protein [Bacteroidaceae bacterium]|nr:fasciclin domain-containing protein [Bacteroidaceae bacterium]
MPEGTLPEWLGESIYEELKNPKSLDGTFNTYLRLIDDLGYAEVLNKTGSKTIFPANDEAFERFFRNGNNKFGKSSYEQLTVSEKSQILYSSMLDNAILVGNLSTQQNSSGEMAQGRIVKHPTNISLLQSVEPLKAQDMPENNPSFAYWKNSGKSINALYDNTEAPMVHFTGEYLLNNGMTVSGPESDFSILTGQEYQDGDAYIFNHKVVKSNVTCQNGYIHQMENVMVNPGNMAQMLRANKDTRHISRMLDYFAVVRPMDMTFNQQYQQYSQGFGTQDSVYAVRYLSLNSQRKKLHQRVVNGKIEEALLDFDMGWNYFNPTTTGNSDDQAEIAAILAPTDSIVEDYFINQASYIVTNLGAPGVLNDKEHMNEHLDAIYNSDPKVIASMLNNIMKPYLSKTVPSKFSTVQNDAFEFLNVRKDDIVRYDGKYNVQIANNGVIYKMSKFFAPELYNSVLGPASVYKDMRIMGRMLNDHQVTPGVESILGADMYYYLLSMKARYALFVPTDNDEFFYIDPASVNGASGLKALKFISDPTSKSSFGILVQVYNYDEATNTFTISPDYSPAVIECGAFNTQIKDMLNYHTVVLNGQNALGGSKYYLTKHGGAIYVPDQTGATIGSSTAMGGAQIGSNGLKKSLVTQLFGQDSKDAKITNGTVYRLNFPIQPTVRSVYTTLSKDSRFTDFLQFCQEFSEEERLYYCGILSSDDSEALRKSKLSKYIIFGEGNVMAMLGTYNYTLFAPQDMQEAYRHGLPKWSELDKIMADWQSCGFESEEEAKRYMRECIDQMHDFVMYHIQNNSVFDDVNISTEKNQTFYTNDLGIAKTLYLSREGGKTLVNDEVKSGRSFTPSIIAPNLLARDVTTEEVRNKYQDVNNNTFSYNKIVSSSFVVVHGIDKPLCYNKEYGY